MPGRACNATCSEPNRASPAVLAFVCAALCVGALAEDLPNEVTASIQSRIAAKDNAGIVVGIVSGGVSDFFGFGYARRPDGPVPDADTVFEIGSITKVFTALLLADLAEEGGLTLDTPVSALLPDEAVLPKRQGQAITLRMLAAHASGLPRIPDDLDPADQGDPYGDYTVERLYNFLRLCAIPGDAPAYLYSNLGYGLLGHALSLAERTPYERLVTRCIAGPLRLLDTRVELSPDMTRRLAQGHKGPVPVRGWTMPVLTGAGGLHSTARDLATLLAAYLNPEASPLAPAMAATLADQGPADPPSTRICLGWHRLGDKTAPIYWQNGGTGGYNGFVGFAPADKRGVVVLTNGTDSIDDIGRHLLDPSLPLRSPWRVYPLEEKALTAFEGVYRFSPGITLDARVVDGILTAQLNDQPRYPVYAQSPTRFLYRAVPAELEFEASEEGQIVAVILHQNDEEQRAEREE